MEQERINHSLELDCSIVIIYAECLEMVKCSETLTIIYLSQIEFDLSELVVEPS